MIQYRLNYVFRSFFFGFGLIRENDTVAEDVHSDVLHILRTIEQLVPDNPHMRRPGRVPGTRELVIASTPFIVPYRLRGDTIQILRVYHGARRWPKGF